MSDQPHNIPVQVTPDVIQRQRRSRAVHVKNVPEEVWRRARQNALASGMPFKDFVIHLLANSSPGR